VHVPYKGIGPAFTDLMGGSLQMLLPTLASATQHIRAETMRGLAVTGAQRSPLALEVPTVSEAGVRGSSSRRGGAYSARRSCRPRWSRGSTRC
jgi:tripartite-type tricarboxylate transporter receptor subunit TctC